MLFLLRVNQVIKSNLIFFLSVVWTFHEIYGQGYGLREKVET